MCRNECASRCVNRETRRPRIAARFAPASDHCIRLCDEWNREKRQQREPLRSSGIRRSSFDPPPELPNRRISIRSATVRYYTTLCMSLRRVYRYILGQKWDSENIFVDFLMRRKFLRNQPFRDAENIDFIYQ